MKIIPNFIKKKYIKLYTNSKIFRNLANSLGIGVGSSFFYGMSAGACPFCGQPITSHPGGVVSITAFGIFFGIISFIFLSLRNLYEILKSKLGWKEKKSSK